MKPTLFETLQFHSGRILFLREHLERLLRSAGHFKIKRGRVRITLEAYPYIPPSLYKRGADLVIARSIRNDPPSKSRFKTLPRQMKEMAAGEAKRKKADEAILLNKAGRVTECSSSNIFLVKNKNLITPPLSEGLLDGITRQEVLKIARQLKIRVRVQPISLKELFQADEIFITSSLKEILPVRSIDKKKMGDQVPGRQTHRLMKAYAKNLRR
ncbi:MAG: aminotransferase class IV [Deltaproteobacteria bacterium]|nr:aminotransferase class IV [Deltaproteobacteria bacterium]